MDVSFKAQSETQVAIDVEVLCTEFLVHAETVLRSDDDHEAFNAALEFARARSLNAVAMGRVLGALRIRGAVPSPLVAAWNREAASYLAEKVDQKSIDESMSQALALHAEQSDWKHRELVADLYLWFGRFNEAFFLNRLPAAVLSVERTNCRNLGWYRFARDGLALRYRINLNLTFAYREPITRLQTLLHEMLHLEQDVDGFYETKRRKYHDKAFQARARAFGIPTNPRGYSLGVIADSPFTKLLEKFGIEYIEPPASGQRVAIAAASRSSSVSWTCGCTKAWVAKGRALRATCEACGRTFERSGSGGEK